VHPSEALQGTRNRSSQGAAPQSIALVNESADRIALAVELAGAFLSAPWTVDQLAESGAACLASWPEWITPLAMRVVAVHRTAPLDQRRRLVELVLAFLDEHQVEVREQIPRTEVRLADHRLALLRSRQPPALRSWLLPTIASVDELATLLELSPGQLDWLADVRGLERTVGSERLRNYRYRAVPRRNDLPRLIEAPKARLKEIQRWILHEILSRVPAHDAAHGFTQGRSAVSHAELHTGQVAVLRLDLKDFFASVPAGRVYRLWTTLGYGRQVAHVLTGLTTNTVPLPVWTGLAEATSGHAVQARFWMGRQLATPHLPQGAPTSPALANLAAFRLDRRLTGLARSTGLRYSRYADDLTFSGPARLIRRRREFEAIAARVIRDEGFTLNPAKSTTQTTGGRQTVCGVVVNVRRTDYDRLKATLYNAAHDSVADQNRDQIPNFRAHLLGRIAWVESLNPARGGKLRELFAQIDWS
jgi:RNA-directed DNA polymerase